MFINLGNYGHLDARTIRSHIGNHIQLETQLLSFFDGRLAVKHFDLGLSAIDCKYARDGQNVHPRCFSQGAQEQADK